MNIFYLSAEPKLAAESMVDRHVVKMILESAQLLSTAHRILDGVQYQDSSTGRKIKRWRLGDPLDRILYSATHTNHPSAIWTRTSIDNYSWLFDHMGALLDEYTFRYNKVHKVASSGLSEALESKPKNLINKIFTKPYCAMDESYIISTDPVVNYRNYYKNGKSHLHKWTKRSPPDWIHE